LVRPLRGNSEQRSLNLAELGHAGRGWGGGWPTGRVERGVCQSQEICARLSPNQPLQPAKRVPDSSNVISSPDLIRHVKTYLQQIH
jgi:hypothetical protein